MIQAIDKNTELKSEIARNFEKFGFVVLKNVFTPEQCSQLKADCKKLLSEMPFNRTGVNVWGADKIPEFFLPFLKHEKIKEALEELYEGPVELLSTKTVFKSKEVDFSSPWHQDRPYWGGVLKISGWISLDDANIENGCLKILRGSHTKMLSHENVKEEIGFGNRISLDSNIEEKCEPVILGKGDVLIFSDLLLHSSFPNTNQKDRWCLIPTYRKVGVHDDCLKLGGIWDKPIRL